MTWGAIVLAAGHSRRMGEANKLTLVWRGKALVAHAVDALIEAGADPILVVTGHDAASVRDALGDRPVRVVHNERHADGMGTSLACGAGALPVGLRVAICLGDMPRLAPETLQALAGTPGAIVAPTFEGRRGHPVFFSEELVGELAGLQGDQGARAVVRAHASEVVLVEVDDAGVLLDVDTPEAWSDLRKI